MLEFVFSYILIYNSIHTKQKEFKKNKRMRNSTFYAMPMQFFKYAYFCRAFAKVAIASMTLSSSGYLLNDCEANKVYPFNVA